MRNICKVILLFIDKDHSLCKILYELVYAKWVIYGVCFDWAGSPSCSGSASLSFAASGLMTSCDPPTSYFDANKNGIFLRLIPSTGAVLGSKYHNIGLFMQNVLLLSIFIAENQRFEVSHPCVIRACSSSSCTCLRVWHHSIHAIQLLSCMTFNSRIDS